MGHSLLVDFAPDARPIGIEITTPARVSIAALNRVLTSIDQQPATSDELARLAP
jgi:hypothetical protein